MLTFENYEKINILFEHIPDRNLSLIIVQYSETMDYKYDEYEDLKELILRLRYNPRTNEELNKKTIYQLKNICRYAQIYRFSYSTRKRDLIQKIKEKELNALAVQYRLKCPDYDKKETLYSYLRLHPRHFSLHTEFPNIEISEFIVILRNILKEKVFLACHKSKHAELMQLCMNHQRHIYNSHEFAHEFSQLYKNFKKLWNEFELKHINCYL